MIDEQGMKLHQRCWVFPMFQYIYTHVIKFILYVWIMLCNVILIFIYFIPFYWLFYLMCWLYY